MALTCVSQNVTRARPKKASCQLCKAREKQGTIIIIIIINYNYNYYNYNHWFESRILWRKTREHVRVAGGFSQ